MINIILADHERVFRTGLASVLAAEDDIRIVGLPETPKQLIHILRTFRPSVLIISSAFLGCFESIRQVCNQHRTAVLLLNDSGAGEMKECHGDFQGVVTRSVDEATIVMYVRQLARGGKVVRVASGGALAPANESIGSRVRQRLTPYELEVISNVVRGYKNREIAARLGTTEHSVKGSLRRIFDKVGVYDRLELALFVIHHGTLAVPPARHYWNPRTIPFPEEFRVSNTGRQPTIQ